MSALKDWLCVKCGFKLGVVEVSELRIKWKDLYVTVIGGKVTEICRKCGHPNTIEDTNNKPVAAG